ncbi:hypothetical protein LT493_21890 [Streptomyces tricolor]|nr:hypothetical protein [Streptomyces tricolor]
MRRLTRRPCSRSFSATARTAVSSPDEDDQSRGAFTAAKSTPSPGCSAISSSVAATATIAPPRRQGLHQPAARGRPAPPRPAATAPRRAVRGDNSPIECPATTSGRTPHDSTQPEQPDSTANNPACVNTV